MKCRRNLEKCFLLLLLSHELFVSGFVVSLIVTIIQLLIDFFVEVCLCLVLNCLCFEINFEFDLR